MHAPGQDTVNLGSLTTGGETPYSWPTLQPDILRVPYKQPLFFVAVSRPVWAFWCVPWRALARKPFKMVSGVRWVRRAWGLNRQFGHKPANTFRGPWHSHSRARFRHAGRVGQCRGQRSRGRTQNSIPVSHCHVLDRKATQVTCVVPALRASSSCTGKRGRHLPTPPRSPNASHLTPMQPTLRQRSLSIYGLPISATSVAALSGPGHQQVLSIVPMGFPHITDGEFRVPCLKN